MRGDTDARRAIYSSESFLSGLNAADLDSVAGIYPSDLDKRQQNIWNYIYYCAWLESKDKSNDTGLETYVRDCLSKKDQSWMPHKTCFALQGQLLLSESEAQKEQEAVSEIQALKDLIMQMRITSDDSSKAGKSE